MAKKGKKSADEYLPIFSGGSRKEPLRNRVIPTVAASRSVKAYGRKRMNEATSFKGMAIVDDLGNVVQIISPSPGKKPSLEVARGAKNDLEMSIRRDVSRGEGLVSKLKIKPITVYQNKEGAWIDYELGRRTYNRNWLKQGRNKVLKNPISVPNTSLQITAVGMDRNGNSTIRLKPTGGGKAFSIQTNNRAMQEVQRIKNNIPDGRFITQKAGDQIRNYIARYGTKSQKAKAFPEAMMRGKSSYQKY